MLANVIDTLRYADRLKEAGVEPGQAEAMARALNAEMTGGLATKADLTNAIGKLEDKVDAGFAAVDAKFEAMDAKFEARFESTDAKFEAMDAKFEAKFDAVDGQMRYVFLALALIVALGLYNAIAPHIGDGATPQAGPGQPAVTAPAPSVESPRPLP